MSKVKFTEVEINRINLKPGDVLSVKLVGELFDADAMNSLQAALTNRFPDNKILVLLLPENHDVQMEVIVTKPEAKDCSQPMSYCNDCSCGKKEMIESISEELENEEAIQEASEQDEIKNYQGENE